MPEESGSTALYSTSNDQRITSALERTVVVSLPAQQRLEYNEGLHLS